LKNCLILSILYCLFASQASVAGPFGFECGMTKEQVIKLVGRDNVKASKDDADTLILATAPKAHPEFDTYFLTISPKNGLVRIYAAGKDIQTNRYGDRVKSAFIETQQALISTYGAPSEQFDFLNTGSAWEEPEYWMTGLQKEERTLSSYWKRDPKRCLVPDPSVCQPALNSNHIVVISLHARASSDEVGFLSLGYEFEGFEEYSASKKAKAGSVF
jgi:hypothetical protein